MFDLGFRVLDLDQFSRLGFGEGFLQYKLEDFGFQEGFLGYKL